MLSEAGNVSSVERAFRMLDELSSGPLGATELAHRLATSKATAFRLARTLQSTGYVVQLEDTRYRLGPRCLTLAASAFADIDLRRELRWAEEELHELTGETALLSVLAGRDAVCIDSIPSRRSVVSVATVGEIWPAHTAAAGLVFLADDEGLLEKYLKEPLTRHTEETVIDPDDLRAMLKESRRLGYVVNRSFFRDGVCAVGQVVHDATGRAVAALSIMMPQFRLDEVGLETLGSIVLDVATRASQRLGWNASQSRGSGDSSRARDF